MDGTDSEQPSPFDPPELETSIGLSTDQEMRTACGRMSLCSARKSTVSGLARMAKRHLVVEASKPPRLHAAIRDFRNLAELGCF